MIIQPTVGRVVWFTPGKFETGVANHGGQPFAALVTFVWNERMVNIVAFDHNGVPYPQTSVPLVQEGDERPGGMFCEWMPYQLGQAKKHDGVA